MTKGQEGLRAIVLLEGNTGEVVSYFVSCTALGHDGGMKGWKRIQLENKGLASPVDTPPTHTHGESQLLGPNMGPRTGAMCAESKYYQTFIEKGVKQCMMSLWVFNS